jgi:hypothetical protein
MVSVLPETDTRPLLAASKLSTTGPVAEPDPNFNITNATCDILAKSNSQVATHCDTGRTV